ncbi:hypothetical protein [Massilia genomosp. 1]|uniref:Uncharacterized protein n=1 Tax=Massilia genomosp. 1 TaxID=2609280 RepID=A0ABX0MTW4_9BURK|nr:hypothetical protein [Massilia genomosp. 1]NHZ65876.1 hypothetical protein [Massilia genomosp. 1]
MDIAELQKLSEAHRQNGDAVLEKLCGAAHLLGAEFLNRLAPGGYVDALRVNRQYSRIIQRRQDRALEKVHPANGAVVTEDGNMLFTLTILLPDMAPPLRIYVDLAVRIEDGVAQYCLWHAPDALRRRTEKWMSQVSSFADAIAAEIRRFMQHDASKGDLADTSVSIVKPVDKMYTAIYGEAPPG